MGRKPQAVRQFRKDGTYIREIKSLEEASRIVECNVSNLKSSCIKGIKCRGYYWRLAEGRHPLKIEVPSCRRDGKLVKVFKTKTGAKGRYFILCHSLQAAQGLTGICITTIRQICRGLKSQHLGYTFEFVNEYDKLSVRNKIKKEIKKISNRRRNIKKPVKLIEIESGEEFLFESITQAARELKINDKGIRHVVVGRYKQTEGYSVEVINIQSKS